MAVRKLGDVAAGTTIKLNESGSPVNYVVAHQGRPSADYVGFENATIIFRKNIHSMSGWGNENDYEHSDANSWLNGPFLNLLDSDIRANIKQVKIPYRPNSGYSSTVNKGSNGLSTKAFLPSTKEVNLDYGNATLGTTFSYFKGAGDSKRIATYNGEDDDWWSRTPDGFTNHLSTGVAYVTATGKANHTIATDYGGDVLGIRPFMPLSNDLYVLDDGTVIVNSPPTAPGSLDVTGVIRGETATITLTAATDPDGTVESYIFERQVDGGAWQKISQANSLTQTDTVGDEWGTVTYRACAVDDMGASGPYITGETFTVNSGFVTIGGPDANIGDKPAPFNFDFVCAVSGQASVDAISVSVTLDGQNVYTGTPNSGAQVSVYIDTRFMATGQHTIQVSASKEDYQPASSTYTFNVPAVALLPYEGKAQLPQNSAGQPVWWYGLARFIFGEGGKDLNTLLQEAKAGDLKMVTGSYQGTGQYNSANPNKIVCGFRPKLVIVIADSATGFGETNGIVWVGSGTIGSKHVTVDDTSFAWYSADSANNQLNTSGTKYFYLIAG